MGVEIRDIIILYVAYPLVVVVLGLPLGLFFGDIKIFQIDSEGKLFGFGTVIHMAFGYLNCCLIPLTLKIDEKLKPLKANLVIGGSFFVTWIFVLFAGVFVYSTSGFETNPNGILGHSRFLFMMVFPIAPFQMYFFGGFGLVWLVVRWKFNKQESIIKKGKLDKQLSLFGSPRQQTRKTIIHQKPKSITIRKKPVQERRDLYWDDERKEKPVKTEEESWDFTWDVKDETVKKIKSKKLPVSKTIFYVKDAPVICNICKQPIKSNEEVTSCPACKTRFHIRHFAEWVRQKGKCPYCNEKIGMK